MNSQKQTSSRVNVNSVEHSLVITGWKNAEFGWNISKQKEKKREKPKKKKKNHYVQLITSLSCSTEGFFMCDCII